MKDDITGIWCPCCNGIVLIVAQLLMKNKEKEKETDPMK
jgi:hypothetical protein